MKDILFTCVPMLLGILAVIWIIRSNRNKSLVITSVKQVERDDNQPQFGDSISPEYRPDLSGSEREREWNRDQYRGF